MTDRPSTRRGPRARRWWRVAVRSMLTLAALAVVTVTVGVLGLRSPTARQAVLRWAGDAVERSAGLRASARDFSLSLLRGELTVEGVVLSEPREEARPFLTVARARAEVSWRSLLGDRVTVRSLWLEGARLDLGAPLPEVEAGGDEPAAGAAAPARGFDVLELALASGELVSGPLPAEYEIWLDGFRAEGVALAGSYRSQQLRLGLTSGRLVLESTRRPPVEATLRATVSSDAGGTVAVESLELAGAGLRLAAGGGGKLDARGPLELSFELRAEPALFFPDLLPDPGSGGRLTGSGALELAGGRFAADLRLDASNLPAGLLGPWLGPGYDVALGGTELDVVAELEGEAALEPGDGDPFDRLTGRATLEWRRGEKRLATASLRSRGGDAPGIAVAFDAEALPGEAGSRRLAGELRAPGWLSLEEGELAQTRLTLEVPDLAVAAERFGLLPGEGLRPAGELRAAGTATGPLLHPDLRLDAAWLADGETVATVAAGSLGGVGARRPLHLHLEASLLPEASGRRELAGELLAADLRALAGNELAGVRIEDVRLDLELPDLAAAALDLRRRWRRLFPGRELPASLAEGSLAGGLMAGGLTIAASASGPVRGPRAALEADWRPAPGESVRLEAGGEIAAQPPYFDGEARLVAERFDIARFVAGEGGGAGEESAPEAPLAGKITGSLDFAGTPATHRADLVLDGTGVRLGGGPRLADLHVEARSDGAVVELSRLSGRLSSGQAVSGVGRFEIGPRPSGEHAARASSGTGELRLEVARPIPTLERLAATVTLAGGTVESEVALQEIGEAPRPVAMVRAPLAALAALAARDGLESASASAPMAAEPGRIWLSFSGLELEPFLPLLELAEDAPRPRATFDGSLTLDLAEPMAAIGTIEVSGLALEGPEASVAAAETLRLELRDRRLELLPTRLLGVRGGAALVASGRLDLAAGWRHGDGVAALVSDVAFDLAGSFDAAALEPFLAGGRASGVAAVELRVRGPIAALEAEGRIDGSQASLFYAAPYATRLEGPLMTLSAGAAGTVLDRLEARLNGGPLTVTGGFDRDRGLALAAAFRDVRYRLDHGLTVRLSGDLELRWPPVRLGAGGRGRLTGRVVVDRGSLRRDLTIGREVLALLFAPDLTGADEVALYDAVDLDLEVTTTDGLRIHNNLAELRADWNLLRVRGTLARPLVAGRLEVDPGGTLNAYGQTVRIDEASVTLSGDSAVGPRIVLETTSSLEDPSIRKDRRGFYQSSLGDSGPGGGGSLWDRHRDEAAAGVIGDVEGGLSAYYTDLFVGSLGSGLASTELSMEPLPIFGETDTQARLTATQRISPNADLIYSVNPREAEGQTYILALHDFDFAPSLAAQIFNNDDAHQGMTLVQTLSLGGGRRTGEGVQRIGAIEIAAPEAISRRRLRRSLGVRKGDPFDEDAAFDVEIDALEELRRQGYPGAGVAVAVEPARRRRLELGVTVEPGPRVAFELAGDRPPRAARRQIVQIYRTTDEKAALEEMRLATVKALRQEGYLEPEVEVAVTVEPTVDGAPDLAPRTVLVHATGGRRIDPGPPVLEGLPAEDAELVAGQFASRLARVELASGEPGADRYLRQSLAALGLPKARIVSRALADDGRRLVVRLEPGARRRLARIEIEGLPEEDATRLEASLPVQEGGPARSDLVTRAAQAIEDDLRERGYAQATVHTTVEPAAERPDDRVLRFAVVPGALHRIAEIRFEGLRGTRERWAEQLAGLEPGETFRQDKLAEARRRLSRTGIFERIRTSTERDVRGSAAPDAGADGGDAPTTVIFDVTERPRFLVSYGGRWESGEGAGAVGEAVDQNFLGRGTTLGLRAIYSSVNERSLRLYHAVPGVLGSRSNLETFLEGRSRDIEGVPVDSIEGWVQITRPLGRRTRNRLYLRHQDLFVREARRARGPDVDAGRIVLPSLGWQLSFDSRDRALGAGRRDGLFASFDLVGSHESLGSDVSALGLFSQLKHFLSFARLDSGSRARGPVTWAQSFRIGLQETFDDTEIPLVTRLRSGGEFSVRGYRRESLGPLDDAGNSLGGDVFLILNQELHFPLRGDSLRGVAFFDAGNVWETREGVDSEVFKSVGIGLRATTPAGPIRLDVAFPLDRREGIDDAFKVYLGFGNIF